ncbi:flagellar hook-associated protein FlgL [Rhodobacteraceae bacterium nBUS_22]
MTISSKLFATQMLDQFQLIEERLQNLQVQISTGSRIPQASDHPLDAVKLSARKEIESRVEQYQGNIAKATDRLTLADTALVTTSNLVARLSELFVTMNTDTISDGERNAAIIEVNQMKTTLLGLANGTDSSGDALFGGYSTEQNPFIQMGDGTVIYRGDGGEHSLNASENIKLSTSINGANVFMQIEDGTEIKSIFEIVNSLSSALATKSSFVQDYSTTDVSTGLNLKLYANREPQNWSFELTGPDGVATISASVNSDSVSELATAITNSGVGVTATVSSTGVLSLVETSVGSGGEIALSDISIEGYLIAQSDPKNYIEVLASDGTTILAKLSDTIQGLGAQGAGLEALTNSIGLSRTKAGARLNNAESQQEILVQRNISIKSEIGALRDADIETLITELQSLLVTRDAARQTYSTVSNKTLFDFLR